MDGFDGLQADIFPVDGFTVQNEQHGIRQGASDEYVSGLARHVDGRGFRLGLFAAQLKDDREGVRDLDGFALDIAGRPVRGGGDDAERLGVQVGMGAAEDFCVSDRAVGINSELQRHAPLDAGVFGGLRILEVLIDPLRELGSSSTLEGGFLLDQLEGNRLRRVGEIDGNRLIRSRFQRNDLGADGIAQEHGSREEGEDGEPGEAFPSGGGGLEHHVDSVFEFGVLEAVRQGKALVPDRFPHQEKLIFGSIDAMIENGVIGLVLMQELEFAEGDPDEGIEPMDQRDRRKQEDVQGMSLLYMSLLVLQDDRILF